VPTDETQLQEIHRLAILGAVAVITQDVGPRLTGPWLTASRFREVQVTMTSPVRTMNLQTLALGPHATTLLHLANAKQILRGCTTPSTITTRPPPFIPMGQASRLGHP
jgi:hypothetical protein